ncbi:FabD/lysophospholipase-like protein [Trichoderma citrinoviride]|uniref:Lysophospholipase n=1 Tax=Trichoderma citrinoviride TaxID=58853 RepID=A0A2T4B3U8_9HYPO|nr:FabD/lysophospholipase-like protein [Trichoderma citrinoviride]PTB64002.1 FabD/lysophospholipase-like protein [Trichoderma citrinoviride]
MRYPVKLPRPSISLRSCLRASRRPPGVAAQLDRSFFTQSKRQKRQQPTSLPATVLALGLFTWWLYPTDDFARLSESQKAKRRRREDEDDEEEADDQESYRLVTEKSDDGAWAYFARQFEFFSSAAELEWAALSDRLVDAIIPEWWKNIPLYVRKLQRELSASPGSLAEEIWQEAHDPTVNPEIQYSAAVRVSSELCDEEKEFLSRRKVVTRAALAKYLGLEENDIHPEDVPTIAMCGSGGGMRALIAGTGSMYATDEDGLLDCVTYTAGVSGSCWLQMLYLSSIARGSVSALIQHLKARASTHIAYPPVAFQSLTSLPTSKYLLSGLVEKLKGDTHADFGIVDIYGILLGARYLIPRGELGVDARDFKLSNQRLYLRQGQWPLPIYTAVRHEIPAEEKQDTENLDAPVSTMEQMKKEPYFQWFELTPYEFFCEEFSAGIPTWALGRRFSNGHDVSDHGFHLPEIRTPLLMGIFGSAFCATLSHYYREIRPLLRTITGFQTIDDLVSGRNEDLSKVHPIDPAIIPNFAYQMYGKLPSTTPRSILEGEYIQLMDAGMSNNLPIYPLLRPGRNVDILIAFDASADIKTDNWLSVADGYARQRGIKGWPVGIGWPKPDETPEQARKELEEAQAATAAEAERKVEEAQAEQEDRRKAAADEQKKLDVESKFAPGSENAGELGYCSVWVGTTEERSTDSPPITKPITDDTSWRLLEPDAGLAVIYLPLLSNEKVPGISPGTTDFLSTWNFVYTPEQIDSVVRLARANYDEGKDQIRATVRAVYERKKQLREQGEAQRRVNTGEAALLHHGDQFS